VRNVDLPDTVPRLGVDASLRNLETAYATILALRQNANRNLALVNMLMRLSQ
jgi:hypothetical protein